ncbi:uncharacterized protein LOC131214376, partial [Anopheles bellator]|uniref:uncharacterized protein LOC131214376 n=1 Tax=Anopheles bellator TaxID=139047 RepID=UPI002649F4D6
MTEHLCNPLLVEELEEKLPPSYQLEWVRYRRNNKGTSLKVFADYMSELIEDITEMKDLDNHRTQVGSSRGDKRMRVHHHAVAQEEKKCFVCQSALHKVRNCDEFKNLSVGRRLESVEKYGLCKNCLNYHGRSACRFKRACDREGCEEKHHPLLHPNRTTVSEELCNVHSEQGKSTIFRTMLVTLSAGEMKCDTVAFFDEGASGTFIEEKLADDLELKGELQPLVMTWSGGIERREDSSRKIDVVLSTSSSPEKFLLKGARTVKKLVLPKQRESCRQLKERYAHLRDVPVEDVARKHVGIMIGLDNIHLFAPLDSKIGQPGEPIAVKSKIGWSIYGPRKLRSDSGQEENSNYHTSFLVSNEELHDVLKAQYITDNTGVSGVNPPESKEERRARKILEATTVRVGNRFETGLLWKEEKRRFPPSYEMAKQRVVSLQRKLAKDTELSSALQDMIQEYQDKGYAHLITQSELEETDPAAVWYLPISVVKNPNKPGKIRMVWDAAASVKGISLNTELLKGPDLLCSLPSVLCPFRESSIGFGGDIKEMYHQIAIRKEDKQAQRFLFPDPIKNEPRIFVMDVATFGSTCSPCSAQYVKNANADEYADEFPEACDAIKYRHYVDDYLDSTDTIEEALTLAKQVKYVHSKGGFHIRNWVSNEERLSEEMGEEKPAQEIHFKEKYAEGMAKVDRVLGILWNVKKDSFQFRPPSKAHEYDHPSKRAV